MTTSQLVQSTEHLVDLARPLWASARSRPSLIALAAGAVGGLYGAAAMRNTNALE